MRARGIKFIGVLVRETKDVYLTAIDRFYDRKLVKILDYERRGGALQRYMPLGAFKRISGTSHA
jgi:hypothetical protein